jgi:hypothetical protein
MFQWLWAMNTNQLLTYFWFGSFCCSCCIGDINERRYESIIERIDRTERNINLRLENIQNDIQELKRRATAIQPYR